MQIEFVLAQENDEDQDPDSTEELDVERFNQLLNQCIKQGLKNDTKYELYQIICDPKMEYVLYEKFNRLCDLYFFMPAHPHKQKNDSENLYLIMTSMAHTKPASLRRQVS